MKDSGQLQVSACIIVIDRLLKLVIGRVAGQTHGKTFWPARLSYRYFTVESTWSTNKEW